MQIYIFDQDHEKNVKNYADKQLGKMMIEYCQLLSFSHHLTGRTAPYKMCRTYKNNAYTKWVMQTKGNYIYLKGLVWQVGLEYLDRFDKTKEDHKTFKAIEWFMGKPHRPNFNKFTIGDTYEMTPFVPKKGYEDVFEKFGIENSFQTYFNDCKQHIARWSNRPTPSWFVPKSI